MVVMIVILSLMAFSVAVCYNVIIEFKVAYYENKATKLAIRALGFTGREQGRIRTQAEEYAAKAEAWKKP